MFIIKHKTRRREKRVSSPYSIVKSLVIFQSPVKPNADDPYYYIVNEVHAVGDVEEAAEIAFEVWSDELRRSKEIHPPTIWTEFERRNSPRFPIYRNVL